MKFVFSFIISIIVVFFGFFFSVWLASSFNATGLNSYLYTIIGAILYLSGLVTFFGIIITLKLKNK